MGAKALAAVPVVYRGLGGRRPGGFSNCINNTMRNVNRSYYTIYFRCKFYYF